MINDPNERHCSPLLLLACVKARWSDGFLFIFSDMITASLVHIHNYYDRHEHPVTPNKTTHRRNRVSLNDRFLVYVAFEKK